MALPLPAALFEDRPFWTGGEDGRLLITRCADCRRWLHPPTPVCRFCTSTAVEPEAVSGLATVFSHTINHQPWTRDLDVPYALAIVELDEDPEIHLTTRLVDVDIADVRIGLRVSVVFEQHDDIWLPLFTPVGGQS
ncbi:MAG: hypothetical protein JWP31_1750 [Aeromicrobium sp.]|nr:hypothetical protein [Aeromicrobium sp.]